METLSLIIKNIFKIKCAGKCLFPFKYYFDLILIMKLFILNFQLCIISYLLNTYIFQLQIHVFTCFHFQKFQSLGTDLGNIIKKALLYYVTFRKCGDFEKHNHKAWLLNFTIWHILLHLYIDNCQEWSKTACLM